MTDQHRVDNRKDKSNDKGKKAGCIGNLWESLEKNTNRNQGARQAAAPENVVVNTVNSKFVLAKKMKIVDFRIFFCHDQILTKLQTNDLQKKYCISGGDKDDSA